jgi:hypothetical protein
MSKNRKLILNMVHEEKFIKMWLLFREKKKRVLVTSALLGYPPDWRTLFAAAKFFEASTSEICESNSTIGFTQISSSLGTTTIWSPTRDKLKNAESLPQQLPP